MTLEAHLRQAEASGAVRPKEYQWRIPSEFQYYFEVFLELSSARQCGMVPCPISYHDLRAWQELNGIQLERWEVDLLRRLDSCFLSCIMGKIKRKQTKERPDGGPGTA